MTVAEGVLLAEQLERLERLAKRIQKKQDHGETVALCHGVFDLLHIGHIRHFKEARGMADALVVTVTPDCYVNKGPHRPEFPQHLRQEVIEALRFVDFCAVNAWPTAVPTIELLKPDFYVKGPDYQNPEDDHTGGILLERKAIESVGGELRFTDDITYSSSQLLNRHYNAFTPELNELLDRLRPEKETLIRDLKSSETKKAIELSWAEDKVTYRDFFAPYFDGPPKSKPILTIQPSVVPEAIPLLAAAAAYLTDSDHAEPSPAKLIKFLDHLLK